MQSFGRYMIMLSSLVTNRERFGIYLKLIIEEAILIGIDSVFIVVIVSSFIGAVTAVQTAYNLVSPFIPLYIIGTIVRDMTILELAPTITCVVLAGKVGSSIAGGLGTMKITEQVDALEVMGINSTSYLILPKIIAALLTFPLLVIIAAFLSIYGGYLAASLTGLMTQKEYIYGIRFNFHGFNLTFAIIKSLVFSFLISSISSYQGYYTKGGALEVGRSSTNAVTYSCIAVLCADFLLAKLLL
ncbi:MAG TPA: ABC transporter permease [Cytophagaceae bacterium]|jgi:phospholipid/cholesterol/gamma-HCH transport system permease protein|nr:ABC transporter permease [Cytophagaceae bacterium]